MEVALLEPRPLLQTHFRGPFRGRDLLALIRSHALDEDLAVGSCHLDSFRRDGDHLTRLYNSAKLYRIDIPFAQDEIAGACAEVVGGAGWAKSLLKYRRC